MKYTEKDKGVTKKYKLSDNPIQKYKTSRAKIEFVPTKAFGMMMFIDDELQLAEKDEYIYHEMLVHPALLASTTPKRICIIGGGDGCAAREVLRWKDIESLDVIDWDSELVDIFISKYSMLNEYCYKDKRVEYKDADIRSLVDDEEEYDCIIVDLLDPNSDDTTNNQLWLDIINAAKSWLAPGGSIVINAGGILPWNKETPKWLVRTLVHNFHHLEHYDLMAYKAFVPSFGSEWCFLMIAPHDKININCESINLNRECLRYFDAASWSNAKTWSKDYKMSVPMSPVNLNTYLPN